MDLIGKRFGKLTVLAEGEPKRFFRKNRNGFNYKKTLICRCDCGNIKTITKTNVKIGKTKSCGCIKANLFKHKKIYGVAINDYPLPIKQNGRFLYSYIVWKNIIRRCENKDFQSQHPTYIGCTVCEEWLYFSNFKKWFDDNYTEGYQLDKDILVKGNKVYSPSTCCFVPNFINTLILNGKGKRGNYPIGVFLFKKTGKFVAHFTKAEKKHLGTFATPEEAFNAYKDTREKYIKKIADEWKDKIDAKVYDALYSYNIEITD